MRKKWISMLLVIAMALSICTVSMAEEDTGENETDADGARAFHGGQFEVIWGDCIPERTRFRCG